MYTIHVFAENWFFTLLKRLLLDILTLGINRGDSITGTCCRDVLKQAEIPIVGVTKCNSTRYTDGQIFNTNICAGFDKGGVDSCQVISDVVTRDPPPPLLVAQNWIGGSTPTPISVCSS